MPYLNDRDECEFLLSFFICFNFYWRSNLIKIKYFVTEFSGTKKWIVWIDLNPIDIPEIYSNPVFFSVLWRYAITRRRIIFSHRFGFIWLVCFFSLLFSSVSVLFSHSKHVCGNFYISDFHSITKHFFFGGFLTQPLICCVCLTNMNMELFTFYTILRPAMWWVCVSYVLCAWIRMCYTYIAFAFQSISSD